MLRHPTTKPFVTPRQSTAFIATLALLFATAVHASGTAEFAVEEIASGVYLHRGAVADIDSPARADSANIGFIVGRECVAVIDSGGAIDTGRALKAAITSVTALPVCYVINTHVHFDHVLGNGAFADGKVRFVGHAELADVLFANREFFAENFVTELHGTAGDGPVTQPDLHVEAQLELDLGGRTLLLVAHRTAHTTTDLTVYDPHTTTLWTGDLLFRERLPLLDGSLHGWLSWMALAMTNTYAVVVPGHGPPDPAWPSGAQSQLRYLRALRDDTRTAIAAGQLIEDAQATVAAEELAHWVLRERAHRVNVSRAYRELEWE
jgi:quinoprotein relay system zinc metallohydrolase 2